MALAGNPSALRQRIVTALLLAPAVIAAVLLLPVPLFSLVFALVLAGATYEWTALAGVTRRAPRIAYLFLVLALCGGIWVSGLELLGACLASGFWLLGLLLLLSYPGSGCVLRPAVILVSGLVLFPGVWAALVAIKRLPEGGYWVLWAFFIVWAADIGAYFAGRAFGRRKLAPRISPGKTWEGVLGGVLFAGLVGGLLLLFAPPALRSSLLWAIPALTAISVVGDLFESALKRELGVKDSGGLLPGHGGLLDRIDSLLAVVPVFAVYSAAVLGARAP